LLFRRILGELPSFEEPQIIRKIFGIPPAKTTFAGYTYFLQKTQGLVSSHPVGFGDDFCCLNKVKPSSFAVPRTVWLVLPTVTDALAEVRPGLSWCINVH